MPPPKRIESISSVATPKKTAVLSATNDDVSGPGMLMESLILLEIVWWWWWWWWMDGGLDLHFVCVVWWFENLY